jgi:8-oxo-dGTP pyrophosphatase MutT (NUDIX family)
MHCLFQIHHFFVLIVQQSKSKKLGFPQGSPFSGEVFRNCANREVKEEVGSIGSTHASISKE